MIALPDFSRNNTGKGEGKMKRLGKKSFYGRLSVVLTSMVLAAFAMGLIFLAPVLVYKYAKKDKGYEAIGQMVATPEKIYNAAVSMAKEKAPNIKILKQEDENMFIEVTDGIQTASVKVKKAEEEGKAEFTVVATVPKEEGKEEEMKEEKGKEEGQEIEVKEEKGKEEGQGKDVQKEKEKELAHRIVYMLCTKLEAECSLVKE
jgi:hypothetical protein